MIGCLNQQTQGKRLFSHVAVPVYVSSLWETTASLSPPPSLVRSVVIPATLRAYLLPAASLTHCAGGMELSAERRGAAGSSEECRKQAGGNIKPEALGRRQGEGPQSTATGLSGLRQERPTAQ